MKPGQSLKGKGERKTVVGLLLPFIFNLSRLTLPLLPAVK